MPKTFLILGAGLTGLPLAHYILKHYAEKHDLKLVLVSRSEEFYWNIAAPRAAIPGQLADDKVLFSIPEAFAKYSAGRFEFVLGTVNALDPDKSEVNIALNDGSGRRIGYDTVIVATGSDYSDRMPWKLVGSSQDTRASLAKLRTEVEKATSIVVGGGGPTGIEFAGELGYEYATVRKKKVTLAITDSLPLESQVMEATRRAAQKELEKLNINIIPNVRITGTGINDTGRKVVELTKADGTKQTIETDLFVPTWGVKFNTSFAPASMREANGRLKVTKELRAPGYDNVFLVGDAANLESYAAVIREAQVRHLASALGEYLGGRKLPEYHQRDSIGMTVAVGRARGVGQMGSWNLWSFLVWYYKGRHMCTNVVPDYVAGKKLILGSF